MTVLFVCTGNTCRSPMAEGIFRKLLSECGMEDITAVSAGTSVLFEGGYASKNAILAAKEYGTDLSSHRTRGVLEELMRQADLVLTMTIKHRTVLKQRYEEYAEKIFTLLEYTLPGGYFDISDPYGGNLQEYKLTASEIKKALEGLINKLRESSMPVSEAAGMWDSDL